MKETFLNIRVTEEEKEAIRKLAGKKTMTQYILDLIEREIRNVKKKIDHNLDCDCD